MKKLIFPLLIVSCVASGVATLALPACQTPAVKHAEQAGLSCAKQDVLQPVESDGMTLLAKVSEALLNGAGKTAIDDGVTAAKAEIATLPTTIEGAAIDCAVKAAIAAYLPLTSGHGFAGGDARLTAAATIGERLLIERGAGGS